MIGVTLSRLLKKAKGACSNSGGKVENHFVGVNKMVTIGSGTERKIDDTTVI